MNRKTYLSFRVFSLLTLLSLLLILPLHAIEKSKAERITNFEKLEEAIAQTQEKIQASPEYVEGYCRLAQLLLMKGEYSESERSLQRALNIEPDQIDSLLTLSRVYWDQYQF